MFGLAVMLHSPMTADAELNAGIDDNQPFITHSLPQVLYDPLTGGVPHELNVERTQAGDEGLDLSARLQELGGLIRLPIHWRVFRMAANSTARGEKIHDAMDPLDSLRLPPGDYTVEADYGLVSVSQQIAVPAERRIGLTLILNVGGIRALSKVSNAPETIRAVARHEIYSVAPHGAGERLKGDIDQGEIVRLGAGTYRVVSTFYPGNTLSEQTVRVKPGILTSLELDHQAAIANLKLDVADDVLVNWKLEQLGHDWSAIGTGHAAQMVLAPGQYRLSARIGGRELSEKFDIEVGQTADITLK